MIKLNKFTSGLAKFATTIFLIVASPYVLANERYLENPQVQQFIANMQQRHAFKEQDLINWFGKIKVNNQVLAAILPAKNPETQRSWQRYRSRFLTTQRIQGGLAFWKKHAQILDKVSMQYAVPPEIILAIIGIETEYARNMGNFRVFEALASLAFYYPPRGEFFQSELEQFLLLARENQQNPTSVLGSFAGALGIPQFMPGSLRRYGVDYSGDGVIDLRGNIADVLASVANFLVQHGWRAGEIVAVPALVKNQPAQFIIDNGILPRLKLSDLSAAGIEAVNGSTNLPAQAALIDLVTPDQPTEYWLGFENFYVITRYNRSSFYAMAVLHLAQELRNKSDL